MNRSPLIYSCALAASLSLLITPSAWSAPEPQDAAKTATAAKAKTLKSKTRKVKAHKAKAVKKAAHIKMTGSDKQKPVSTVASGVSTNPYLVNQPVSILPKAANPYLANSGITPIAAATVATKPVAAPSAAAATAIHAPAVAAPVAAPALPAPVALASVAVPVAVPIIAAPIQQAPAAPVIATVVPNAAKPFVAPVPAPSIVPAPVAAMPTSVPVPAYQPWSPAASYRNPYLAYQQPYTPVDPSKLFGQFGDGLKMALPALPAMPNLVPAWPANPVQSSGGVDIANTLNGVFASLKMMLPLTGDANILPTIKKVYPTGEKPLVVINFKCPTEVLGVTPPPMKLLHEAVNLGFEGLNKTNLLSFNLQQVCS